MMVEHSPWFENGTYKKIPIEEFHIKTISFTYRDSMPTFSQWINDRKYFDNIVSSFVQIFEFLTLEVTK